MILPYIEQNQLYNAWNLSLPSQHPNQQAVVKTPLPTFLCPSDNTKAPRAQPNTLGWFMARGNYGANGGTGRLGSHSFGNTNPINGWYENLEPRRGLMNARQQSVTFTGRTIAEVRDGTSNTVAASELIMSIEPGDDTFINVSRSNKDDQFETVIPTRPTPLRVHTRDARRPVRVTTPHERVNISLISEGPLRI